MNKYVVYTAIFNNYDWLKDPVVASPNIDFICYTDSYEISSKVWKIIHVDLPASSKASILNRKIKLLYPFDELLAYDYSLYVDGSIMLKGDIEFFINKYVKTGNIIMNFKHPNNDCIFEEILRCIKQNRGNPYKLLEQYVSYKNDNMPAHFGMSDNKIIFRNNKSIIAKEIMNEWYYHVINYSGRDQVCLSYVLYKHKVNYCFFDENIENNEFFEAWPHNNDSLLSRIWRRVRWFCQRHKIFGGLIIFLEKNVKPHFIK